MWTKFYLEYLRLTLPSLAVKFDYRPKVWGLLTLIVFRTSMTLSSILSFSRQYFSHWPAEVKRLMMIRAILAAPY